MYLRKAGTVILGISILLWAMTTFPRKTEFERDYAAEASAARATMLSGLDDLAGRMGMSAGGGRRAG